MRAEHLDSNSSVIKSCIEGGHEKMYKRIVEEIRECCVEGDGVSEVRMMLDCVRGGGCFTLERSKAWQARQDKAWQSNRRNSCTFSEYDGEIGVVC